MRFFWLFTLAAAGLATLCVATAVYLFQEQTRFHSVFRENVASRKAAVEMEKTLAGLIAPEDRAEPVSVLRESAEKQLNEMAKHADESEEKEQYAEMTSGFAEYLKQWDRLPAANSADYAFKRAEIAQLLRDRVLKPCREFRLHAGKQLEQATEDHESVLRRLGIGMAVVGGLGAISGLVVGFGVARALTRSIRRLQVQIGDAAHKLGPRLPQIVLTRDGDFRGLHEQVDHLAERIEAVVAALQEREREVLRAEQLAAVGQLAAGVAHEVRNPLTSIKMLIQLALEQSSNLSPEDLGVIDGEIRKMENSLRAFLNFARPPKAERRPVNLLDVVAAVLGLIRGRSEKQHVSVKVCDTGRPLLVTADPDQLRQVLVNLTLNALDAMPTGGMLYIVIRESPKTVEVEVADTGQGIAAEMAPKLFQPFVSGKETGVGLGLVISLRIAEAHGGTLTGTNRDGGGAIFTLTLPRN
jgi:signal transduction histidine kinase